MTHRLIYTCDNCGATVVIEARRQVAGIGQVCCDCSAVMKYEGVE